MHRVLPITALVLFAACPVFQPDTCNDGKAFGVVTFDDAHPPMESSSTFDLRFEKGTGKGATLPDSYFDAGVPSSARAADGGFAVTGVQLVEAGRLRVSLAAPLGDGLDFSVMYPDRRGFIDCSHPGAPDRVELSISVRRGPDAGVTDGGYGLGATETTHLGPI